MTLMLETSRLAEKHHDEMLLKYAKAIKKSATEVRTYREGTLAETSRLPVGAGEVVVEDIDLVTAIFKYGEPNSKMAVWVPVKTDVLGNGFIYGRVNAESMLCHYSYLYEIQSSLKESYYKLFEINDVASIIATPMLYLDTISFENEEESVDCSMILCPVPESGWAPRLPADFLTMRIGNITEVAKANDVYTLILYACEDIEGILKSELLRACRQTAQEQSQFFNRIIICTGKSSAYKLVKEDCLWQ